ncbi:MAG TPA: GSU2403 family nucleotidyltransferase fold protein [Thermoanaerobaculia bacterium]|nr:GSU2403 family nucleotidyltransferase fold protein [Thermoanaerobaculia bacterium]
MLEVLAERGLFRAGAVLIGTLAYAQYGNLLGIGLDRTAVRTADVDLLHDSALSLAIDPTARKQDLSAALVEANPEFLAVPPLDPKQASSLFKVRGRDLRVDFLTPAGRGRQGVRRIRGLGVAAQALPHLGYLLDDVVRAVVLYDAGVLVNLPDPARFLLHKIWTAGARPATEALKSRKDLAQAGQLLEVLSADRPGDLSRAWKELPRSMVRRVVATVRSSPGLEALRDLVPGRPG